MSLLSVIEYQTLPVCAALTSPSQAAFTFGEVDALDRVGLALGVQLIEHVSRTQVRCRQYVGLVRLGERDIEFLPKIESPQGEESPSVIRHNLLKMLFVARDIDIHIPGEARALPVVSSWLDAFIEAFCRELSEQVRRGLTKRYRTDDDDLHVVRGRVLLDEQVTRNVVHQERIACEFDEFDENNALNQAFKLALTRMMGVSRHVGTQRLVRSLLASFDSVDIRSPASAWWRSLRLDRLTARYRRALDLARLFLDGFPLAQGTVD